MKIRSTSLILLIIILLSSKDIFVYTGYENFTCSRVTEIPEIECEALVTFYRSTNGPNWVKRTNWLTNNKPCGWSGVVCISGHVKYLEFYSNGLSGTLPAELSDLAMLERLRLPANISLSGNIPPELGQLNNLELLDLSQNSISGNIPTELGKLKKLKVLNLQYTHLNGHIPSELALLTDLEFLNLSANNLIGGIPAGFGRLTKLKQLDLHTNQLSGGIPRELGNLTELTKLMLAYNQLTGSIPPEIGKLVILEQFWLNDNKLSGYVPSELGDLKRLKVLSLNSNIDLTGALPESLTGLSLDTLHFEQTNLCEPSSTDFQTWLINSVGYLGRTGQVCTSLEVTEMPQTGGNLSYLPLLLILFGFLLTALGLGIKFT